MTTLSEGIVVFNDVEKKLAKVTTVAEAVELKNQAAALEKYVRGGRKGLAVQNRVALVKALCERRAGELLRAIPRAQGKGGGKGKKKLHSDAERSFVAVLEKAGISDGEANRWQFYATCPEAAFKKLAAECQDNGMELTTSYFNKFLPAPKKKAEAAAAAKKKPEKLIVLKPIPEEEIEVEEETGTEAEEETEAEEPGAPNEAEDEEQLRYALAGLFTEALSLCEGNPKFDYARTLRKWIKQLEGDKK